MIFQKKNLIIRILKEKKNIALIFYGNNNIYFGEIFIENNKFIRHGFGCYFFDGDDYYRGYWNSN